MDQVLAKVKGLRKKPYFKVLSDQSLFDVDDVDLNACILYNPDHNLDEDAWFKIEAFSTRPFCIDLLKQDFDSKDYNDLTKGQFLKIAYLFAVQNGNFYFQKTTPSLFVKRKALVFGEAAELEKSQTRLIINTQPDAVYFKIEDTLIFRSLATISSIFSGIDELFREATEAEVQQFLAEDFIALCNDYNVNKVSKPNRKRIGLAMVALNAMSAPDRTNLLAYIDDYCGGQTLRYDEKNKKFEISNDDDLKQLLYGIEQRFYTTPFGQEKRLANSVVSLR